MAHNNPKTVGNKFVQHVAIVGTDGNTVTPVSQNASGLVDVNIKGVNGKVSGSFFGDNFITTNRIPIFAAKWSQGLPVHEFDVDITNGGKWKVMTDAVTGTLFDGTTCFETNTEPDAKVFITSLKKNRYLPGHLSFFGYTIAWHGQTEATGDFVALVGAMNKGSVTEGRTGEIRDGMVWGIVRESGELRRVVRFYKNFTIYYEKVFDVTECTIDCTTLNIFEHQIGYYGIHPSLIWYFNKDLKQHELLSYDKVESIYTTISDPNLSWGVYLENKGNTTNIQMFNGSLEFGNYTNRPEVFDAAARPLLDQISIDSIAVDPDDTDGSGFLAAYLIPDTVSMISEINATTVYSNFNNTIVNQLLSFQASGTANRPLTLNIYMFALADVTATFTPIRLGVNLLEKATSATVNHANRQLIAQFAIGASTISPVDVRASNFILSPNMVAVLTLTSTQATTASDINILLQTNELF